MGVDQSRGSQCCRGTSWSPLGQRGRPIGTRGLPGPPWLSPQDEKDRIEALGGFVSHMDCWRVNGTLAVSRAIGKEVRGVGGGPRARDCAHRAVWECSLTCSSVRLQKGSGESRAQV